MINTEREKCIQFLLKLGSKDLTEQKHPGKPRKKYLRYNFNKTSWVDFNFDYPEHNDFSVKANKRKFYRTLVPFSGLQPLLTELGIANQ